MRVTNQMVNHAALKNMQRSQSRVSDTTTRMTSGKKIQKASEDPVIAMRALKLRSTVAQLDQYKEKNIKDANSWMFVTETSLNNIVGRLSSVYDYCVQGANDTYDSAARSNIVDGLQALKNQIYAEGSATYAGRYLFSGYRTSTDMTFATKESVRGVSYDITEHLGSEDFKRKDVVTDPLNYDKVDGYINGTEPYTPPRDATVSVLKLAYNNLDVKAYEDPDTGDIVKTLDITFDGDDLATLGFDLVVKEKADKDTYYAAGANEIIYIPETGELVFGEEAYNAVKASKDIQINYSKSTFEVGDLRPDHYFDCIKHEPQSDGTIKDIHFEQPEGGQNIQYEVNFNQFITVNTQGKDVITHAMGHEIDELTDALQALTEIEDTITKLKAKLSDPLYSEDKAKVAKINQLLEDADIEMALKRTRVAELFEKGETTFTNFMNKVSAAQADVGTRMNKLDMIATRVAEQYDNFDELRSANEDVETEEAIIEFNEANLVYNASLAATSNILQTTLLDYL